MPLRIGVPYQAFSFNIKTKGTRTTAQDDKGRVKYSNSNFNNVVDKVLEDLAGIGGAIRIRQGIHTVKRTIEMTDTHPIYWFGEGQGSIDHGTFLKLDDGVNADMFYINPTSMTLFHSFAYLTLYGNKDNNAAGSGIVNTSKSQDLTVDHVYIREFKEHGLKIARAWGLRVYGCPIEANDGSGIYSTEGSEASVIGCYLDNNAEHGMYLYNAFRWDIIGTSIQRSGKNNMELNGTRFTIIGGRNRAASYGAPNTYDCIRLDAGADFTIIANVHFQGDFDGVNYPKYGVNIQWTGITDVRIDNCTFKNIVTANINDNGTRTRINGLGRGAYGVGGTPTAADWEVGDIVRNTDDNTIWIKCADGVMRQLA